jgi:cell division protein FtsL
MEIVPKPPKRVPIFEKILFFLSFSLFILVILSFFFLLFSVGRLNSKKSELEEKISELKTPEIKEMEKELSALEKRFLKIEDLLNNHLFISHFFPFLESKILKNVTLDSLRFNVLKREIKISGVADNFPTLSKQYSIFKEDSRIENPEISKVSIGPEGKVNFEILFSFKEEVIK